MEQPPTPLCGGALPVVGRSLSLPFELLGLVVAYASDTARGTQRLRSVSRAWRRAGEHHAVQRGVALRVACRWQEEAAAAPAACSSYAAMWDLQTLAYLGGCGLPVPSAEKTIGSLAALCERCTEAGGSVKALEQGGGRGTLPHPATCVRLDVARRGSVLEAALRRLLCAYLAVSVCHAATVWLAPRAWDAARLFVLAAATGASLPAAAVAGAPPPPPPAACVPDADAATAAAVLLAAASGAGLAGLWCAAAATAGAAGSTAADEDLVFCRGGGASAGPRRWLADALLLRGLPAADALPPSTAARAARRRGRWTAAAPLWASRRLAGTFAATRAAEASLFYALHAGAGGAAAPLLVAATRRAAKEVARHAGPLAFAAALSSSLLRRTDGGGGGGDAGTGGVAVLTLFCVPAAMMLLRLLRAAMPMPDAATWLLLQLPSADQLFSSTTTTTTSLLSVPFPSAPPSALPCGSGADAAASAAETAAFLTVLLSTLLHPCRFARATDDDDDGARMRVPVLPGPASCVRLVLQVVSVAAVPVWLWGAGAPTRRLPWVAWGVCDVLCSAAATRTLQEAPLAYRRCGACGWWDYARRAEDGAAAGEGGRWCGCGWRPGGEGEEVVVVVRPLRGGSSISRGGGGGGGGGRGRQTAVGEGGDSGRGTGTATGGWALTRPAEHPNGAVGASGVEEKEEEEGVPQDSPSFFGFLGWVGLLPRTDMVVALCS